jgi:hypothetical protein
MAVTRMLQVRFEGLRQLKFIANFFCSDTTAVRTLATGVGVQGSMTIEKCTDACYHAGFPLAGAEYARECCELDVTL